MDFLSNLVQQALTIIYNTLSGMGFANYGIAIIVLTVIIKLALHPLTVKQMTSMKKMTDIQPKMKELQERYKDDKDRLNFELANLYKKEGVNPLSGCLPLLIQMPIMIGIFYGIRDFQYVGPTNFLWLESIANPDPTYILPILSALTTLISSKQMSGSAPMGGGANGFLMTYGMPVFIGYISIDFPAGLVLYWVVMNIMQIAQQAMISKSN